MDYKIEITSRCINCDNCRNICPEDAVFILPDIYAIDNWACSFCGLCIEICPADSIKIEKSS